MAARRRRFADLGEALRRAREAARPRLSQVRAAALLETSQTQLSLYEIGDREAPLSFVRKAEAAYGRSILGALPSIVVPRDTPAEVRERPAAPYGSPESGESRRETRDYYRGILRAAQRVHALAAELMQEAAGALDDA